MMETLTEFEDGLNDINECGRDLLTQTDRELDDAP